MLARLHLPTLPFISFDLMSPAFCGCSKYELQNALYKVVYDVVSFLEKNTDKLHADIMNLLKPTRHVVKILHRSRFSMVNKDSLV